MQTLIAIDMQNDFITGSLGSKEAESIVPAVIEKVKNAQAVWYTLDTHRPDYLDTQEGRLLPVPHCIAGTPGWELQKDVADALSRRGEKDEYAREFRKPTFGSIEMAKDAAYWFRKFGAQDEDFEVELAGLCTDICVISNALLLKAFVPEMKITVDASCCAGTTPEKHMVALETMRSCQIEVIG